MPRILLIEDNPRASTAIQAMLEALGHRVRTAPEGGAALRALAEETFDLVLTDIMMPGLDGMGVLAHLARHHPDLPVVAMTGRQDSSYLRSATRLGARRTLYKPFTLEELQHLLAHIADPL
jgi:CheY-like chemotaxis protein